MKKYLQISEVEEILGVSKNVLRYIEKTHKNIKIHKIRGRRYYQSYDLDKIAAIISSNNSYGSIKSNLPVKIMDNLPQIKNNNLPEIVKNNIPEKVFPQQLQIFSKDQNLPVKTKENIPTIVEDKLPSKIYDLTEVIKDLKSSRESLSKLLAD